MRRMRKMSEQRWGFLTLGERPLEGGVRRPSLASWSYLLHLPSRLLLALLTRGWGADESQSGVAREAVEAAI